MTFKISTAKSARHNRRNWREDMPPESFRIKVADAVTAAGNGNKLAQALGVTRGAVYQWKPPYRHDPYLPLKAAVQFVNTPELWERYQELFGD